MVVSSVAPRPRATRCESRPYPDYISRPRYTLGVRTWPALATIAAIAACRDASPGERQLLAAIGDEVDLVAVTAPRRIAGTWVERAAYTFARDVPACVRERARKASAVAVTWDQAANDVTAGTWSFVMIGGGATAELPACYGLERGDGIAWYGADPRRGTARFFATEERVRRWRALGNAPVRAIADAQAQPGILMRASATLDPSDGVDAKVTVRFDERAAASGAMEMILRERRRLDRERLGGAWPAFQWKLAADPTDPKGASLRGELMIPGARGEEAMLFAAAAIANGGIETPGAPCHVIGESWVPNWPMAQSGRFSVRFHGNVVLDAGMHCFSIDIGATGTDIINGRNGCGQVWLAGANTATAETGFEAATAGVATGCINVATTAPTELDIVFWYFNIFERAKLHVRHCAGASCTPAEPLSAMQLQPL